MELDLLRLNEQSIHNLFYSRLQSSCISYLYDAHVSYSGKKSN